MPARDSLRLGGLPLGLAHGVRLQRAVACGDPVRWDDVAIDTASDTVRFRREMEAAFRDG
jgi:predicted homoserine dehydrogenase-like protein